MSNDTTTQHDELIAKCVEVASTVLGEREAIMQIRRGQPTFGRNYTVYYKVDLATLNPSGVNKSESALRGRQHHLQYRLCQGRAFHELRFSKRPRLDRILEQPLVR